MADLEKNGETLKIKDLLFTRSTVHCRTLLYSANGLGLALGPRSSD